MKAIKKKISPLWLTVPLCFALAVLGVAHFTGYGTKPAVLLAGFAVILMLALGDLKRLMNLPTLLLLGFVLFSWLTAFWAMSGKFHLREWSKLLVALAFFLFIVLYGKRERPFLRRVAGIIAGVSAIYAFASVEAASTGVCKALVMRLPGTAEMSIWFDGSRLSGVFGNSNIESSLFAVGILLSVALLCGSEKKRPRILFSVTLSFCAFAFLLVFSMFATACFAAAVVVYLIFAGNGRSAALLRMLEAAVPTVVFAFFAARLWSDEARAPLVLLLLLANAAVTAALELLLTQRLSAALEKHQKLAFGAMIGAVVLCAAYALVAVRVTDAYTFGNFLSRSTALEPGEHVLQIESDADVQIDVFSQTDLEIMSMASTLIHSGVCSDTVSFTVPTGAEVCSFRFSAPAGTVLRSAVIDGRRALPLNYKLLPDFIGNRVQNLTNNTSVIQRRIFREDALKLFRRSPIVGSGVGAFETGVTAVQEFSYETKYVHNHYIQLLLEDGVIGLALFLGALVTLAAALWKKRKQAAASELCWLYPALCAEFVMNGAQMLWDVSMSAGAFTSATYACYALIVLTCAAPLSIKKAAAPAEPPKGTRKQTPQKPKSPLPRIAAVAVSGFIVLTLCGNMYASALSEERVTSEQAFFRNQQKAARLDLYEHNDAMLSYVVNAPQASSEWYLGQANKYAEKLARVQSNTIPRYLVAYYLQTAQYEAAIDEAMLGATYSATDASTWNRCAALFQQAFFDSGEASPLLTARETLMPRLMEYYDALQAHNASALLPVVPDEAAQAFFDKLAALNECGDDAAFAALLTAGE